MEQFSLNYNNSDISASYRQLGFLRPLMHSLTQCPFWACVITNVQNLHQQITGSIDIRQIVIETGHVFMLWKDLKPFTWDTDEFSACTGYFSKDQLPPPPGQRSFQKAIHFSQKAYKLRGNGLIQRIYATISTFNVQNKQLLLNISEKYNEQNLKNVLNTNATVKNEYTASRVSSALSVFPRRSTDPFVTTGYAHLSSA